MRRSHLLPEIRLTMALQLNLLHEEITQERQRKRDPLKLGIIALSCFGAIFFLYYGWNAYRTIQIKGQLNAAEREWQKTEPKVTAAQKRATELRQIIDSTKVLNGLIEDRFYWAPFLAQVSHCVAPNLQVTSLDGSIVEGTPLGRHRARGSRRRKGTARGRRRIPATPHANSSKKTTARSRSPFATLRTSIRW